MQPSIHPWPPLHYSGCGLFHKVGGGDANILQRREDSNAFPIQSHNRSVWHTQSIITDHGTHFCNAMMAELTVMLHLDHEHSSPYYPHANGQVESINYILRTMLQRMVGKHKSNWHVQLF
jgi:transposase InsO family protein